MKASTPRRERTLVYGRSNAGKSSTWLDVANWFATTETPNRIHLGCTDFAWQSMRHEVIEPYVDCTDLDPLDFMGWVDWARRLRGEVDPDDWVVLDRTDILWEVAQETVERKRGHDLLADVKFENLRAIETRNAEGELMGGAHGSNWGLIKSYYSSVLQPFINVPCHVMAVCDAKEINKADDAYDLQVAQWKGNYKPAGEKNLPGLFRTWIFCQESPQGWRYTTKRDTVALGQPPRAQMQGQIVENGFVLDYLVPVCGWEL